MTFIPRTLQELVLSDLARAKRLIESVHPAPIDPQFRIATPEGDMWIAITLTEKPKERTRRLKLISDFMAWKLSPGFVLATELHQPDAVVSVGIMHGGYAAVLAPINRKPLSFQATKAVLREQMDPEIINLMPRGARTLTTVRLKELDQWFGPAGKFPAVPLRET